MITLEDKKLTFRFPDVHPKACLDISFLRTLRIPDDGETYPLPPGLDTFPLEHVDDHMSKVPGSWLKHGGVMLPMHQSEAMWIKFSSHQITERRQAYPFAIKIAAGKIDAVSGKPWTSTLNFDHQNYVVSPRQPWLDGFCVEEGTIRQFVAMPLGEGYTVEEQLVDGAYTGGLQIQVYPMKREAFEERYPEKQDPFLEQPYVFYSIVDTPKLSMGLGAGGKMKQEIKADPYEPEEWALETSSRCFVHLANSQAWQAITGSKPPTKPLSAAQYSDHKLPWFDHYSEGPNVTCMDILSGVKSVNEIAETKGLTLLENDSVDVDRVIKLRSKYDTDQVREGEF